MTIEKITEIFCLADNFVKFLEKNGLKRNVVGRKSMLSPSEFILLLVLKQAFCLKTNKILYYFTKYFFKDLFSQIPSYQQFNDGLNRAFPFLVALTTLLIKETKKKKAKFYVVDSLPLSICSNGHRYNVKIDNGTATSGKNLNGWYHGYKFHMIINQDMEIVGIKITNASVKDHAVLEGDFIKGLIGWLVGDKGYICKEKKEKLHKKSLNLLTRTRKNMKKYPITPFESYLLSQRQIVESVFSKLKYRYNIVTGYARSLRGYFVNVLSAVVTYCLEMRKNLKIYLTDKSFQELLIS